MTILVIAEVRWGYMHHRKKGILRRLPKDWQIVYVEPLKLGKKIAWYRDENVRVRSIFCYKKGLDKLFDLVLVRRVVSALNYAFVRVCCLRHGAPADVVVVSNYGVFDLQRLRALGRRVVVDLNDIPRGFGLADWVEAAFHRTIEGADRIVVAAPEWRSFRDDAVYIGNGVDFEAFNLHRHHR